MDKPVAVTQTSFAAGELTPSLAGRIDLAAYYTALKTCRNFIVRPFGGVTNRPGFQFITAVKTPAKLTRLIPFQYSADDTYVLEFGHLYIRILKNGAYVLSGGNPVEIVTPWGETVLWLLKYVQSGDVMTITYQGTRPQQLSRLSETSWTLAQFANVEGPFLDINVDTTKTVRVSGVTGSIQVWANTDGMFSADDVGRLLYIEQLPDYSTPVWEPATAVTVNAIVRAGTNYYQAMGAGTTGTTRPDILDGSQQDGFPGVKWMYLHSGFGVARITGYSSAGAEDELFCLVLKRIPDVLLAGSLGTLLITDVYGIDVGSSEQYAVEIGDHGLSTGAVVTISGVVGPTDANGTHTITVIDSNNFKLDGVYTPIFTTVPAYISGGQITGQEVRPTYKWAKEAWGAGQYPMCSTYYQQRQIFGGRTGRPQQINMSNSGGAYLDFSQSVPLLDDEAISFDLVANRKLEIRHLLVMRDLVALTSEGPWAIQKQDGPIPLCTPQGKGGISHIPPLEIESRALYVPRKGNTIKSIGYNWEQDGYDAKDLTLRAAHLFFGKQIVDWCYQEIPFQCVWVALSGGALVGMTYVPEQEVIAWHRHDTDGIFESVCCVSEGTEDVVYAVVKRLINGTWTRYVERMANRFFTDRKDAFFVDSGLSFDGAVTTAWTFDDDNSSGWTVQDTQKFVAGGFTGASDVGDQIVVTDAAGEELRLTIIEYLNASSVMVTPSRGIPADLRSGVHAGFSFARDTFSGLGHLEGKTVSIYADGKVAAQKVATGGAVAVSPPAAVVHIGLPITADLETLNINAQGQTLQDKVKNVGSVILLVEETRGLAIGPDADHLLDCKPENAGTYDDENMTGALEINILSDWSKGGRIFIRQTDPLPVTILSAIPQVVVGNV